MLRSAKLFPALAIGALLVGACSESQSPLPTASSASLAKAPPKAFQGARPDFPPDGWVFHPAQLPPGFTRFECTFGHSANISSTLGPDVACQSRQWGHSGIFREQARDLVALGPAAQELCGGPAHFDVIRLCSEAWIASPETPWGEAGGFGCVIAAGGDLICGVG